MDLKKIAFLLAVSTSLALAQTATVIQADKSCEPVKPGCTIKYYVRFDGDPQLNSLTAYFNLQGEQQPNQGGLTNGFQIDGDANKLEPGLYEVSSLAPTNAATGEWLLVWINAGHRQEAKRYDFPSQLQNRIVFKLVNDAGYDFPPIKSVTNNLPK
jgi:hypothetical protein